MRAFIIRVIFVVVFLIGLSTIAEKVSLIFQPEEKDVMSLAEFEAPDVKVIEEIPAPDLKVVKLGPPPKIVFHRRLQEDAAEVRMKIGPVMPAQFEHKVDIVWEKRVSK